MSLHLVLGELNHRATVSRHTPRDLQTRELADLGACEAIHRVGADLERKLSAIEDASFERIGFDFEVGLCAFSGGEKGFENLGKKSLADRSFDEIIVGWSTTNLVVGEAVKNQI